MNWAQQLLDVAEEADRKKRERATAPVKNRICPECNVSLCAISKKSGMTLSYCLKCHRDINRVYRREKRASSKPA